MTTACVIRGPPVHHDGDGGRRAHQQESLHVRQAAGDAEDAEGFLRPNPDLELSLPMRRMAELLAGEGIIFVDPQPELAALRRKIDRDVYNGPRGGMAGHLGPEDDRLIGEIAARSIERILAPT